MVKLEIGGWCVEHDPEATRTLLPPAPKGYPERCGCRQCENFLAGSARPYPQEALSLLALLGIDPKSEVDVSHMGPAESGLHRYVGWFHFVGRMCPTADGVAFADPGTMTRLGDKFEFFFWPGGEVSGRPFMRLEFACEVPWVLSEAPL